MMNKKIQVLKPFYRKQEILKEITDCLDIGWTGIGYKTVEFERAWQNYSGLSNSLFLSSATAGLHLAINALKEFHEWGPDSEIITSPITFVSTNHAILYEGLKPVFADVNNELTLDVQSVEKLINEKTKAVVFVGVGGRIGSYQEIVELCKQYRISLILDAAHMAGTKISDVHVGQDSDVAVFSFQAVKNLPTADSGMINCINSDIASIIRKKSWMGIDKDTFSRTSHDGDYKWSYDVPDLGFKYNGNSIMAAMGIVGLRYLDGDNIKRQQIAKNYRNSIKNPKINFVGKEVENQIVSTHLCQILVDDRDLFIDYMAKNNVFCGVHYLANNDFEIYRGYARTPNARYLASRLVTLPCHLHLDIDDIGRVTSLCNNY